MNTAEVAAKAAPAEAASLAPPRGDIPMVKGLPILGNVLDMARDPARFFHRCYREYGRGIL